MTLPPSRLRSLLSLLPVAALALSVTGCLAPFRSATPAPIPSLEVYQPAQESPCTALLLPGTWDYPRDYARHGFGELAQANGTPLALIAVDTHVGYYKKRSVVLRLHEDFVAPLRAKGERVWLVGASLGGVGSLIYAAEHADEIEGMVLLAPFLGDKSVLEEIRQAGGPLAWQPPAVIGKDDWQRRVWKYLQEWHAEKGRKPAIYVAYGRNDNFAEGIKLLAQLLPAENVRHLPGGHDWKTWKQLWQGFLDDGIFGSCLAIPKLGLINEKQPLPGITSAGQPTADQLAAAKAAGYKTVVNLRPASEDPSFDEAAKAEELGLGYVPIPISGPADLTEENAAKLLATLRDPGKMPMLVHCASSNRVGGLLAVGNAKLEGAAADDALKLGLAAGLSKLEPAVRQILGLPPLPPAEAPVEAPVKPPGG